MERRIGRRLGDRGLREPPQPPELEARVFEEELSGRLSGGRGAAWMFFGHPGMRTLSEGVRGVGRTGKGRWRGRRAGSFPMVRRAIGAPFRQLA